MLGGGEFPDCDYLGKQRLHLGTGQKGRVWILQEALQGPPLPPQVWAMLTVRKQQPSQDEEGQQGSQGSASQGYPQGTGPLLT